MQQQFTILTGHDGGNEGETAAEWDARAMLEIGRVIQRYLSEFPPPAGALTAEDFHRWGRQLTSAGRVHLQAQGLRELRVA